MNDDDDDDIDVPDGVTLDSGKDARITIIHTPDRFSDNIIEAMAALANVENLFRFGDALVEVILASEEQVRETFKKLGKVDAEIDALVGGARSPRLLFVTVDRAVMRDKLAKVVNFLKLGKGLIPKLGPIFPPDNIVDVLLKRAPGLPVPEIKATRNAPVVRRDGSIAFAAGFDPASGVFIGSDFTRLCDKVPTRPTQDDCRRAWRTLYKPVSEFPFVDEIDKACWLGHLLTHLTRHFLALSPAWLYSGPESGTGKTLLAATVSLIALGRGPTILVPITGDAAYVDNEMRKRLFSLGLAGVDDPLFDNLPRGSRLGGPVFDGFVTAEMIHDRILGVMKDASIPNTMVITNSGNATTVAHDSARRIMVVRQDAGMENPGERTFTITNLPRYIQEHRDELLVATLTILAGHLQEARPFARDYKPTPGAVLPSFEDWSNVVAGAVEYAGLPNPVTSQVIIRETMIAPDDDSAIVIEPLLTAMHAIVGNNKKFTIPDLMASLSKIGGQEKTPFTVTTPQRDALWQAIEVLIPSVIKVGRVVSAKLNGDLGRAMFHHTSRVTPGSGYRLFRGPGKNKASPAAYWITRTPSKGGNH